MLHTLFLRDYRLPVSIGIHPHERAAPQPLVINVTLLIDRPVEGDDIAHVVDYDFLRDEIARLTDGRHFETQEALAQQIVQSCRRTQDIVGVRVSTEKPDIYPDAAGVGCRFLWLDPAIDTQSAALLMTS